MDKIWKGQSKTSLHQSKPKLSEYTPSKIKSKDFNTKQKESISREEVNILPREIEIQKSLQNIDLNVKIDDLTTEITVLKEKLTDINLSNIHLKNMLREKNPSKSVNQRITYNITDQPVTQQQQQQQMKQIDKSSRQSMPQNEIHFIPYPQQQRTNHLSTHNNINTDELKEKDKQIEQLKEKSKQLESLVVTLENKLDKSNTLLPNVISKAKEYHRLYDETKRENQKIKNKSKSPSNVNTIIDYSSNSTITGGVSSMKIEDNKENEQMHKELRKHVDSLARALREEKEHSKSQIEEMKAEITRLSSFKKENDKLVRDLAKSKEDNEHNLKDLTERSTKIYYLINELNEQKTLNQKNEKDFNAQISKLINEKDQLLQEKNKLYNDYNTLNQKNMNDNNELSHQIKINNDFNSKNNSLNKALLLKNDEITHNNNTIKKNDIEKKKLQLEIDQLIKEKLNNEQTASNDALKFKQEKEEIEAEKQKMKIQLEVYQLEQKDQSIETTKLKKDNEILKQYLSDLKEDLLKLQKENQNQCSLQVINLKTQLSQSEEKHKQLLLEKDNELKTLTVSYGNKDEEVVQFKKTIKERMYEIDALKEEVKDKDKIKQQIDVYEKKINDLSKSNQALYIDVSKYKTIIETKEKEIMQLSGMINQLKEEIKDKEVNMQNLNEANEEYLLKYNEKIKSKDEELNKCHIGIKDKDEEMQKYQNFLKELDIQRQEKDIMLKEQDITIKDKECLLKQKEKIICEKDKEIKDIQNKLQSKEQLIYQQDQMIQERNEMITQKDNKIKELLNEEIKLSQSTKSIINEKMNTIDKLSQENIILNKQTENYKKQIEQLQYDTNSFNDTTNILNKYNFTTEIIDSIVNDDNTSIDQINYPDNNIPSQAKQLIENIILNKKLLKYSNEISLLKQQLNNEHNIISQQSNKNSQFISQLSTEKEALQSDYEGLMNKIAINEKDKAALMTEIEEVSNELNLLKESYALLENNKTLIQEVLTKDKEDLEKKYNETIAINDKSYNDLLKKNEDYKRKITELKTTIENKNHHIIEHKKTIEKKDLELNEIQHENEEMTTDMISSQSKLTEMTMKFKRIQNTSEQNENSKNEELNQLKIVLKEKEAIALDLQKQINEKDKIILSKEDIIALLDKEVIEYKEIAIKSQEEQEKNENEGKEIDETIQIKMDDLMQQLTTLNKIKEAFESKSQEATLLLNEKNNQAHTINTLQATNDELKNNISTLNISIINKDKAIAEALNKQEELLKSKDKEIALLKQLIEEDKLKASELQNKQLIEYNEQLNQLTFKIEQKESEISSSKRQNQLNEKELNTLHLGLKDNKGIIKTLNDEIQRQKLFIEQMNQLDHNLKDEKNSNEILRQSLQEQEILLLSKDTHITNQENQIKTYQEEINTVTSQLNDANKSKEKLLRLQTENKELKAQMMILIEESSKSEVAIRMAQDTIENESYSEKESLKAKIFNLEHELQSYKENIINQSNTAKELKSQCEEYKSQYQSTLKELDDSKRKEYIANEELSKVKANEKQQKIELENLTAQIFILTTNSANFTCEVDKKSKEIEKKFYQKEQENIQLNSLMANIKIEHKALQEEYDAMTSEIVTLKESLIEKDIELRDNEESHQRDIEDIAKIRDEYQDLTDKLLKIESLPDEVNRLQSLLDEKTMELRKHQEMIDKLIHINQEMSEKVNQKSSNFLDSKQLQPMTNTIIEGSDGFDKDDFISLQMKNDSLNELIKIKEDEITTLRSELEIYKLEIVKVMNNNDEEGGGSVNDKEKGSASLLGNSLTHSEDMTKIQDLLIKTKQAYKEKSSEVTTLQQQLSLLKGDIRNYQIKIETIQKESCPIKNYEEFKGKLRIVLENYKPKKKEQIDIVKEIKSEIGIGAEDTDERSKTPDSQGEKKKGFFNFSKK